MTFQQALKLGQHKLAANPDVENPSLESEVLLRFASKIDRATLFLKLPDPLPPDQELLFQQCLERRLQGEPVAYIIRNREFYGLDFYVDGRVLIPRPETELLVEEALSYISSHPVAAIADIGTGSGAIAVSLAVTLSASAAKASGSPLAGRNSLRPKIYGTDISSDALEVARLNSEKHQVAPLITFLQGDLLAPIPEPVDLLIANLPYVSQADLAGMPSARYEPALALDGGEAGLDQVFRLCRQIKGKVNPGGRVLMEIGLGQGEPVISYLRTVFSNPRIELVLDLAGIPRVVRMDMPG